MFAIVNSTEQLHSIVLSCAIVMSLSGEIFFNINNRFRILAI